MFTQDVRRVTRKWTAPAGTESNGRSLFTKPTPREVWRYVVGPARLGFAWVCATDTGETPGTLNSSRHSCGMCPDMIEGFDVGSCEVTVCSGYMEDRGPCRRDAVCMLADQELTVGSVNRLV